MSADKFSATLRNAIISRVADTLQSMDSQVYNGKIKQSSPLTSENIRNSTNLASQGYEAIVSRGGLTALSESFIQLSKDASETKAIQDKATEAATVLADPVLFDKFTEYIKTEKYKDLNISGIQEPSPQGFMYEASLGGEIRVGTAPIGESSRDIIAFRNLDHGDLKDLFVEFLSKKTSARPDLVKFIDKNLNSGHLTGVFNARLRKLFNTNITQSDNKDYRTTQVIAGENAELNNTLTKLFVLLADADYLSSNIIHDIGLFSNTTKKIYGSDIISVSVELQLAKYNQEAGRKLVGISKAINNLIIATDSGRSKIDEVGANQAYKALFENFKAVSGFIEKLAENYLRPDSGVPPEVQQRIQDILSDKKSVDALIETEGSDSMLTAIAKIISSTIAGTKMPSRQITAIKRKDSIKVKPKTVKPKKSIPKFKDKKPLIPTVSSGLSKSRAINLPKNLTALQNLLNARLVDQVKKNMGNGTRNDVLNLQTGRFAESVEVTRLSESRQGMITAFYTYMKNPYATFSAGGRQEFPTSRDPKTLIAKSIREIAAEQVSNRLRSVLV